MTSKPLPIKNTDNDRISRYLEEHGSITSYEIRKLELSGNPSQRITDLIDTYGYEIEAEPFTRIAHGKTKPCRNYILKFSPRAGVAAADPHVSQQSGVSLGGSDSGQDGPVVSAGAPSLAPVEPLQLFEVPEADVPGHIDLDQRDAA